MARHIRAVERSAKAASAPTSSAVSPEPTTGQTDIASAPASTTQTPAVTAATPQPKASQPTAAGASGAGAKTYVVRAGDSLWLIAKRILSPTASNADIARLVNQLWTLNASRIRTGNPNMLGVGVVLALP